MRSVSRTEKPQILIKNERVWTIELLTALNKLSENISFDDPQRQYKINKQCKVSKVTDTITSRYNHPEIKLALQNMYEKRCCYCEGKISAQTIDHIEHFRPKSLFPHLVVDWDNLHCCCPICNQNKKDRWDHNYPILDPTIDRIEDHLGFDLNTGEIINIQGDLGAQNTIDHPQLNRLELVKERKSLIKKYRELIKGLSGISQLNIIKKYIEAQMLDSSYPTLHQKILDEIEKAIHEG